MVGNWNFVIKKNKLCKIVYVYDAPIAGYKYNQDSGQWLEYKCGLSSRELYVILNCEIDVKVKC